MTPPRGAVLILAALLPMLAGACSSGDHPPSTADAVPSRSAAASPSTTLPSGSATAAPDTTTRRRVPAPFRNPLPGMPPVLRHDVYAGAGAGDLAPQVRHDPPLVYVPDSSPYGSTVTVISQRSRRVVRTVDVGHLSQHVVPSYGLHRLYVNSSSSDELVRIDPLTGKEVGRVSVPRPYNLYFTPDGKQAVVMVEEHDVIRFSDPVTFQPRDSLQVAGCRGPNHADFSANGRFMVITCEFSGALLEVRTSDHKVLHVLHLPAGSMPQDVRLSPDGRLFYVADMGADVVRLIRADTMRQVGVIPTPQDPHGLYPSRDAKVLYVSDRGAGKVSVISFRTHKIVDTWTIPGGGSPDMGGVSADGKELWLSGRYDSEVYVFDTRTGHLLARIPVPGQPHGLCVWPQPGRYSLGHTGNMR